MPDRPVALSAPATLDTPLIGRLAWLERLLPLWILLAMAGGLLLGRCFPALQGLLDTVKVGQTSLPIALGLLLMMYPVLTKVRYGEISHVGRDRPGALHRHGADLERSGLR